MKYETIGGKIHDTEHGLMTLRELALFDRFTNKNKKGKWEVVGDPKFSGHGSAIRKCKSLTTGNIEYKSCRMTVYKL